MKQFSALPGKFLIFSGAAGRYAALVVFLAGMFCATTPAFCYAKGGESSLILPAALTHLTALSNSTIAVVTGTGLPGPAIGGTSAPRGAIVLWDELRPTIPQPNLSNSNSVVTLNGAVQ